MPASMFKPKARQPLVNRRISSRSEEHTSELQSQSNLVCRLLLEKKKNKKKRERTTKYIKHSDIHCRCPTCYFVYFFFNDTATTEIYTLSLHDALPISGMGRP